MSLAPASPRAPGTAIVGRQFFRGRAWHIWAGTIVREDEELTAVWSPRGTEWLRPVGSLFGDWTHEPDRIKGAELRLTPPDTRHSLLLFWHPDDTFKGWYVNLERDFRATAEGFAYEDDLLDIWIEPDGSWKWLDEDELKEAVDRGFCSPGRAAEIRADGERVLADWPFPTGWEEWKPDPTWDPPRLPHDIKRVQAAQ